MKNIFLLALSCITLSTFAQLPHVSDIKDLGFENGWVNWQASEGYHKSNENNNYPIFFTPGVPQPPRFRITNGTAVDSCSLGTGKDVVSIVAPGFGYGSLCLGQTKIDGLVGKCVNNPPYPSPGLGAQGNGCSEKIIALFNVNTSDTNFLYGSAIFMDHADGGHLYVQAPFAEITIMDNADTVYYKRYCSMTPSLLHDSTFYRSSCTGVSYDTTYYKPWGIEKINLSKYVGKTLQITLVNTDCALGGHACWSYWDFNAALFSSFVVSTPDTCSKGKGTATAKPIGGTSPYKYFWNNGQTTQTITGLLAGTVYSVVVVDANGLKDTSTVTIYNSFYISFSSTPVSCFGGNNGAVTAKGKGGTSPYTYLWSNNGQTTASITGLLPNTYSATVTDSTGCIISHTVTVTSPSVITNKINTISASCSTCADGSAFANPSGGTPPYQYSWSTQNWQTTSSAIGLTPGQYTVCITDNHQCKKCDVFQIDQLGGIDNLLNENVIHIFPNPSKGVFQIQLIDLSIQSIEIEDILGKKILFISVESGENKIPVDMSDQHLGMYFLRIKSKWGVATRKIIISNKNSDY